MFTLTTSPVAQSHPIPPSCTHLGHHTPQLHLICVSPIVSLYGATILSQANNVTQTCTAWYRPAQAALSALTAYLTVGASGLGVPGQGETLGPWRAALKQHPTAQRDSIVRRRHVMDDADLRSGITGHRVGLFKIKAHRQDAALLRLRATWLPLRSVEAQRPLAPVLTTHLLDSITTIPYFTHIVGSTASCTVATVQYCSFWQSG